MSKTYLVVFCLLATSLAGCLSEDTVTHVPVIPYEPWNATIMQSEWMLNENYIYYQQFTAPSTGEYTGMTIFAVSFNCNTYDGVLGTAVYTDNATYFALGEPRELITQGNISLTVGTIGARGYVRHTIQFDDSAYLTANTIYWVAIASDSSSSACRLESSNYDGYNPDYRLVKYLNGFTASEGFPTSLGEYPVYPGEYAYWYRIF